MTMASYYNKTFSLFFFFFFLLLSSLGYISSVSGEEDSDGIVGDKAATDGIIISEADYQGLQAFRHALDDPHGVLRSWNGTGIGACSGAWLGVKCVGGKVVGIQLPWRGLGGRISEKIGQLTSLRKLSLHDNSIGGQIPAAIGFLQELRGLYLFNNLLSGAIPQSIGNCVSLQAFDLSNNQLVGSIPSSIANSTNLYRLNLSYNNLSGVIPAGITRSSSLAFLSLHHNNLSGTIPDTWNSIPDYHLQILNLDHNTLSGDFPSSLSNLRMLREISVSYNNLSGSFPPSICKLSSLSKLDIEGNHIEGGIPEAIDGLKNLSFLTLKRNRLNGEIPARVGNISSLSWLDLSENNFTGDIPSSLGDLADLTFLDVSYNNLSGAVPSLLAEKFNSSSFRGNLQLCGYSASVPCPSPPPSPSPSNPPPPVIPEGHRRRRARLSTREIILTVAGVVLAILLLLCCILLCCLLKKRRAASSPKSKGAAAGAAAAAAASAGRAEKPGAAAGAEAEAGGEAGGKLVHFDGPLAFAADDLLCATAEIMGKSTYGTVYKATLEDGNQVAVKRLREKITKGQKEFEAEVSELGKIRHRNLLALRAYYLGPKGEKLLVFDFMPKGSLAAFLHARGPDTPINWATRMRIAKDVTRGVAYLHDELKIVHGNITSSNVVLDDQINARISDYGLSRLMTSAANANVAATAAALGYRAPELSKLKKPANPKTDVYSLGVIILELLTGKSPADAMNGMDLPQWVSSIVKEEWTNEVFDVELMRDAAAGGAAGDEMLNTLKLALHCVDPSPAARPEAKQVMQQLEEIRPEGGEEGGGGGSTAGGSFSEQ